MKKIILFLCLIIFILPLFADQKGNEIAKKYFSLKESRDCSSLTLMVLINKKGEKKIRKLESYSKEGKNGRNSFMKFVEPADVKGTTFLIIGYNKGDDEQRIYLPALGKIRRISSSNKDQKFMGSDLTYYDMEDHEYNDFTYKYIKDDNYEGMDCHVIEMYPTDKNSPYSKQVTWISKKDFFAYKLECYDKKRNKKIKTIVSLDVKSFDGVLIPQRMVVDNHVENHKTLVQDTNIKINKGLKDTIFTIQNMQK
jgi:outer membrane lipoprotein-sorting protein